MLILERGDWDKLVGNATIYTRIKTSKAEFLKELHSLDMGIVDTSNMKNEIDFLPTYSISPKKHL